MNEKLLIKTLSYLFKWTYHLNLIIGFGIIGFTVINFIKPIKVLSTAYLGKFNLMVESTSLVSGSKVNEGAVYFDTIAGNPSLVMNSSWHGFYVFVFVACIVLITLVYNYQLWRLFDYLKRATTQVTPFTDEISKRLEFTAKFSILIFILGALASTIKIYSMKPFSINKMVITPAFDNQIINFLWVAIGLYIIAQVYKVGVELKKEKDLTI
ncbi:MAG: DUF2975 domain-containing protein [Salinivirgaceae bacterium]